MNARGERTYSVVMSSGRTVEFTSPQVKHRGHLAALVRAGRVIKVKRVWGSKDGYLNLRLVEEVK